MSQTIETLKINLSKLIQAQILIDQVDSKSDITISIQEKIDEIKNEIKELSKPKISLDEQKLNDAKDEYYENFGGIFNNGVQDWNRLRELKKIISILYEKIYGKAKKGTYKNLFNLIAKEKGKPIYIWELKE